jgi:hypothetical protein
VKPEIHQGEPPQCVRPPAWLSTHTTALWPLHYRGPSLASQPGQQHRRSTLLRSLLPQLCWTRCLCALHLQHGKASKTRIPYHNGAHCARGFTTAGEAMTGMNTQLWERASSYCLHRRAWECRITPTTPAATSAMGEVQGYTSHAGSEALGKCSTLRRTLRCLLPPLARHQPSKLVASWL